MDKILSVSIAAYNVEDVIGKCLDSFIDSQFLSLLDIIIVDDGSVDKTSTVTRKYVNKYPDSLRLISKKNGGHGSTINIAILNAKGKYFKVVDSDDWVDTGALDRFIQTLLNVDVDLLINDYNGVYPNRILKEDICRNYMVGKVYSFNEIDPFYYIPMHAITIKTISYKKLEYTISENCFYVDTEYVFFVGMCSKTILFNKECVYQYRLGQEGQSVSKAGIYKHIEDLMCVIEKLMRIYTFESPRIDSLVRKQYLFLIIQSRCQMVFRWYLTINQSDKDKKLKQFYDYMNQNFPGYMKNINLGIYDFIPINYTAMLCIGRLMKKFKNYLWKK